MGRISGHPIRELNPQSENDIMSIAKIANNGNGAKSPEEVAEAAYNKMMADKYGAEITLYGIANYGELRGQPKGQGVLMGAYTIGSGNACGWGTINAAGKFTAKRGQFTSRGFRMLVGDTAYKYWTHKSAESKKALAGPLVDDDGLTALGVEMVKYRLGLIDQAPTKSGRSPARTSAGIARDFAELIAKGPKGKRAGIKEALNPVEWFANVVRKREPHAK